MCLKDSFVIIFRVPNDWRYRKDIKLTLSSGTYLNIGAHFSLLFKTYIATENRASFINRPFFKKSFYFWMYIQELNGIQELPYIFCDIHSGHVHWIISSVNCKDFDVTVPSCQCFGNFMLLLCCIKYVYSLLLKSEFSRNRIYFFFFPQTCFK